MASNKESCLRPSKVAYYLFLFLGFAFTSISADAKCTKEDVEKKVQEVCRQIESKGKAVKKAWPKDLIYENCGDNYVWVQDTNYEIQMIIHPIKRRLDGTSLRGHEDENKFRLFVEFDRWAKAKPDGAWVDYIWAKPGQAKATPKSSYVMLCTLKEGTSWVVGSGIWLEDLEQKK